MDPAALRHWCCSLVVGVKQSAPQNVALVGHKVYHVQMLILPKHESKRDYIRER